MREGRSHSTGGTTGGEQDGKGGSKEPERPGNSARWTFSLATRKLAGLEEGTCGQGGKQAGRRREAKSQGGESSW